jgi:hypothetical protein
MLQQTVHAQRGHISSFENFNQTYSPMPSVTRTIAQGIPARVRSPAKTSRKSTAKKTGKNSGQKSHKRNASEDSDDETDKASDSDDSEPRPKKRKAAKRQRTEDQQSEVVNSPELPSERVEEVDGEPELTSGNEVSTNPSLDLDIAWTHRSSG